MINRHILHWMYIRLCGQFNKWHQVVAYWTVLMLIMLMTVVLFSYLYEQTRSRILTKTASIKPNLLTWILCHICTLQFRPWRILASQREVDKTLCVRFMNVFAFFLPEGWRAEEIPGEFSNLFLTGQDFWADNVQSDDTKSSRDGPFVTKQQPNVRA